MPIVDKLKLHVSQIGINYEINPLFVLPAGPVFNLKHMHKNKVHLVFHEVPENNRIVAVFNNLSIATGSSSQLEFATEWMPIRPLKDKWCQAVDQLHNQFIEIVVKPLKKNGFNKGIVSIELSKCDPLDKYKENTVVLDKSNIEINGKFYDGIVTISGEMDIKPFSI